MPLALRLPLCTEEFTNHMNLHLQNPMEIRVSRHGISRCSDGAWIECIMKSIMRRCLRAAVVAACVILAGCVSSRPMPAAWADALARPSDKVPAVAGTFEKLGSGGGQRRLDVYLWGEKLDPAPQKIRLRLIGQTQLEATALNGDKSQATKIFTVAVDKKTGGVSLPGSSNLVDVRKGGAGWETHNLDLFMGNDGRLYGHVGVGGAVLYAYVIPVAGERLLWFCWAPASP